MKNIFASFIFVFFSFSTTFASAANFCKDALVKTFVVESNWSLIFQTVQLLHLHPESIAMLSPEMRHEILSLSGDNTNFNEQKTFELVLTNLQKKMGPEAYDEALGNSLTAAKRSLPHRPSPSLGKYDMNRFWGWKLLDDSDPIFTDPEYLKALLEFSGMTGSGKYFIGQTGRNPEFLFKEELAKISPNVNVERFAMTGTDANNAVWELADKALGQRDYAGNGNPLLSPRSYEHQVHPLRQHGQGKVLVFEKSYVGVYGAAKENYFARTGSDEYVIPSPLTYSIDPMDSKEIARLEIIEQDALQHIERMARDPGAAVSALLLEPIIGAQGVLFYRSKFLREVRELCDRYNIPLVVDEILTGGGRTGKFFGFENYSGFEPDFITFGKGLQVAGIATYRRLTPVSLRQHGNYSFQAGGIREPIYSGYLNPSRGTTTSGPPESLIKGAFILKRIREGNLMKNAREVGAYFLRRLRETTP